ncbi:MAG: hypothetical protein J6866_03990, partial [Victivallales bacterium]|nr:hypothetical protein [Victivallales bacterium]
YDAAIDMEVLVPRSATVYTVEGVYDGDNLRQLSLAELVMVVCLARATEKERIVIELMSEMSETTNILNALSDIESKLLEGLNLDDIMETYTYKGVRYFAKDFLAIVVGGATPPPGGGELYITLWNELQNKHIVEVTGDYPYGNNTYTKAYQFLHARGLPTMSIGTMENFYDVCEAADALEDGQVISDADLMNLSRYNNVSSIWSGMTKEDLIEQIDVTYKERVLNGIQMLAWQSDGVPDADSYLPSGKDDLITEIESKMDSLNTFSQQKMIELQSETNKRDQAYDMITNILKSLNTVQVGISNNI